MSHHVWAFCQRAFEKSCRSANHPAPSLHSFLRIWEGGWRPKEGSLVALFEGEELGGATFQKLVEGTSYFGSSTRRLSPQKCGLKLHWVWELTSDKRNPGWNWRRSLDLWNTHKFIHTVYVCVCTFVNRCSQSWNQLISPNYSCFLFLKLQ